ncbi:MAG: hypothetical protein IPP13_03015 [Kouleothrix sp.]|nr:hypothetical protein [Kouleothrix sp.]
MRDIRRALVPVLMFWMQAWYEKLHHLWMLEIDIKSIVRWGLIGLLISGIVLVIAIFVLLRLLAPLNRL